MASGQDMRQVSGRMCRGVACCHGYELAQVLHNLSLWSATDETDAPITMDVAMEAARNAKKHSIMV